MSYIQNRETSIIHYKGDIDENGIWGIWDNGDIKGGFHIWPIRKDGFSEVINEEEEYIKYLKLE